MAVEYDTSTTSSSTLTDLESVKESENTKHHTVKRGCCRFYRHLCPQFLGRHVAVLVVPKKYSRKNNFILIAGKYVADLYQWTHKHLCGQLFADDFLRSIIASIALFAVGIKFTGELTAWTVPRYNKY